MMKLLVVFVALTALTTRSSTLAFASQSSNSRTLTTDTTTTTASTATCLNMASSSSSSQQNSSTSTMDGDGDLKSAKSQIAQAISIGAPAYNAGDIDECARVYQETATNIVKLLPTSLQQELSSVLAKSDQQQSTMDLAWAFRKQFDTILDYKAPYTPTKLQDSDQVTLEPFTDRMIPQNPVVVNDNVMGGISQCNWNEKERRFTGSTSLANNGGFASLRWRFQVVQNWSYAKGIYLKGITHSKPLIHTFRLLVKDTLCERVRIANYKTIFANPDNDDDNVILIPFTEFDQMEQMGRTMDGSPPLNRGQVTEIGIMAIKPSVVGEFELHLKEWGLYL